MTKLLTAAYIGQCAFERKMARVRRLGLPGTSRLFVRAVVAQLHFLERAYSGLKLVNLNELSFQVILDDLAVVTEHVEKEERGDQRQDLP